MQDNISDRDQNNIKEYMRSIEFTIKKENNKKYCIADAQYNEHVYVKTRAEAREFIRIHPEFRKTYDPTIEGFHPKIDPYRFPGYYTLRIPNCSFTDKNTNRQANCYFYNEKYVPLGFPTADTLKKAPPYSGKTTPILAQKNSTDTIVQQEYQVAVAIIDLEENYIEKEQKEIDTRCGGLFSKEDKHGLSASAKIIDYLEFPDKRSNIVFSSHELHAIRVGTPVGSIILLHTKLQKVVEAIQDRKLYDPLQSDETNSEDTKNSDNESSSTEDEKKYATITEDTDKTFFEIVDESFEFIENSDNEDFEIKDRGFTSTGKEFSAHFLGKNKASSAIVSPSSEIKTIWEFIKNTPENSGLINELDQEVPNENKFENATNHNSSSFAFYLPIPEYTEEKIINKSLKYINKYVELHPELLEEENLTQITALTKLHNYLHYPERSLQIHFKPEEIRFLSNTDSDLYKSLIDKHQKLKDSVSMLCKKYNDTIGNRILKP